MFSNLDGDGCIHRWVLKTKCSGLDLFWANTLGAEGARNPWFRLFLNWPGKKKGMNSSGPALLLLRFAALFQSGQVHKKVRKMPAMSQTNPTAFLALCVPIS